MSNVELDAEDPNFDETEQDISMFASVPSVAEVLKNGNDLGNIYLEIGSQLEAAEAAAINDYMQQIDDSKGIIAEIKESDVALAAIEEMLVKFKASLGQLSTDICTLQAKSQTLTTKLGNRKKFEEQYGEFTQSITLTREFITNIMSTDIGVNYVSVIEELHKKLNYIKNKEIAKTQAAQEIAIPLDRLRLIASNNIRNWFVNIMKEMIECYGTEQIAIQHKMLKCKAFIKFLNANSSDVEQSARDYYSKIMSRIYLENFKMLANRLKRQMAPISVSKENLVPIQTTGFFFYQTKRVIGEGSNFFSLGERAKLLNEMLSPPQPFGDGIYPFETFFRSLYQTLIDTVTMEHKFSSEFFESEAVSSHVFHDTIKFLENFFDDLFGRINDPICIVLVLRFVLVYTNEMKRRKIDKLNLHLQGMTQKLTLRLSTIIGENVKAVQTVDPKLFIENTESAHLALAMTRRFSEFAKSMIQLLDESIAQIVKPELDKVSQSVNDCLIKTSKLMVSEDLNYVFLLNNYSLILDTISLISTDGPIRNYYDAKYSEILQTYLNFVIKQQFPDLMDAVLRAYSSYNNRTERPIAIDITDKQMHDIAFGFRDTHSQKTRASIERQRLKFGDFDNGSAIARQIAERIAFVWGRFELLVKENSKDRVMPQWWSQMPTAAQLASEYLEILNDKRKK